MAKGAGPPASAPDPVIVRPEDFDAIRRHAEREYPLTACGVIMARGADRRVLICQNIQDELHAKDALRHPRDARTAFFVAPQDLLEIGRMENQGFHVGVIYHSNPDTRAFLSGEDRSSALLPSGSPSYPTAAYLVMSVMAGGAVDSAAFRWDSRRREFVDVPLVHSSITPLPPGHRHGAAPVSQASPANVGHTAPTPKPRWAAPRPLRVFLCHSSSDKALVRRLYRRLQSEPVDPWLDEDKLLPGQDWDQEIARAVRAADVVLVCLSREAVNRAGFVQREIRYALDVADQQPEGTIFLIPAKLETCDVPERLRRWHWVELFEPEGYEGLLRALQERSRSVT